jgi:hypothetical protein
MGVAVFGEVLEREWESCWISTSAWMEMLKVDLWVMRKRVSRCALILWKWKMSRHGEEELDHALGVAGFDVGEWKSPVYTCEQGRDEFGVGVFDFDESCGTAEFFGAFSAFAFFRFYHHTPFLIFLDLAFFLEDVVVCIFDVCFLWLGAKNVSKEFEVDVDEAYGDFAIDLRWGKDNLIEGDGRVV